MFRNLHKNRILYYQLFFVLSVIVDVDFLGVLFALVFFFSCGNSRSRAGVASLGLPRPRLTTAALDTCSSSSSGISSGALYPSSSLSESSNHFSYI